MGSASAASSDWNAPGIGLAEAAPDTASDYPDLG